MTWSACAAQGQKNTVTEERNSVSQLIWEKDPHPKAIIFLAWKLKGKEADKEGKRRLAVPSHGLHTSEQITVLGLLFSLLWPSHRDRLGRTERVNGEALLQCAAPQMLFREAAWALCVCCHFFTPIALRGPAGLYQASCPVVVLFSQWLVG